MSNQILLLLPLLISFSLVPM